ncbi:MAG: hypothetical protein ABEH78_07185 [Haloferacaceae archaeon]
MSDEPTDEGGDATGAVSTADSADEATEATEGADDAPRLRRMLNYGLLAGLLLLALVSAAGVYTAVSAAISTWVTPEWRPLFRAAFNLAVLLLAGAGIAWQARRMR